MFNKTTLDLTGFRTEYDPNDNDAPSAAGTAILCVTFPDDQAVRNDSIMTTHPDVIPTVGLGTDLMRADPDALGGVAEQDFVDALRDAQAETGVARAIFNATDSVTFEGLTPQEVASIADTLDLDAPVAPPPPPTPAARTLGDPHLLTLDGLGHDFHAVGEYVLLRGQAGEALGGFEIQSRMTPVILVGHHDIPHLVPRGLEIEHVGRLVLAIAAVQAGQRVQPLKSGHLPGHMPAEMLGDHLDQTNPPRKCISLVLMTIPDFFSVRMCGEAQNFNSGRARCQLSAGTSADCRSCIFPSVLQQVRASSSLNGPNSRGTGSLALCHITFDLDAQGSGSFSICARLLRAACAFGSSDSACMKARRAAAILSCP